MGNPEASMESDLEKLTREELIAEIVRLRGMGPSRGAHVEVEERLLLALARFTDVNIYTWKVAEVAGIGQQLALYHLIEMEQRKFVTSTKAEGNQLTWSLAHDGRGYLVGKGLLA
jgi:hypothetical protein